jgi:hypothetical protein
MHVALLPVSQEATNDVVPNTKMRVFERILRNALDDMRPASATREDLCKPGHVSIIDE